MIKIVTAIAVASALSLGSVQSPPEPATEAAAPTASTTQELQAQYAGYSSEEIVEEGLAEEGLELEQVDVSTAGIEIEAEAAAANDPFEFALELDAGKASGEVTFTDKIDGEIVTETYDIDIQESTVERTVFTLTNPKTGEIYEHDSAEASSSVAFVIPLAFGAISISTALYYLAVGAAIVIGGALALEAGKAISKIIKENSRKSKSKKRDYYPATLKSNKVFISAKGLTKAQAVTRGKKGKGNDVWALSKSKAKSLAVSIKNGKSAVGPEISGGGKKGYMWHYHPNNRTPSVHLFYGSMT
ncbi:hypothetical protein [Arthrobacter sp. S41]|uniref:hypothetical protein n=1 Tax=Micrococcaceae TaxID=1268 RepID=UPI0010360A2E|nr:hypothetical protein [Arthrobacter sp. S41]TAP26032.1 hypothetical protein EYR88_13910 [Arthrobacter sp. S41]